MQTCAAVETSDANEAAPCRSAGSAVSATPATPRRLRGSSRAKDARARSPVYEAGRVAGTVCEEEDAAKLGLTVIRPRRPMGAVDLSARIRSSATRARSPIERRSSPWKKTRHSAAARSSIAQKEDRYLELYGIFSDVRRLESAPRSRRRRAPRTCTTKPSKTTTPSFARKTPIDPWRDRGKQQRKRLRRREEPPGDARARALTASARTSRSTTSPATIASRARLHRVRARRHRRLSPRSRAPQETPQVASACSSRRPSRASSTTGRPRRSRPTSAST